MLQKGVNSKTTTVIEQSSGSTVISLSIIARVLHRISDVHAYLSNKTQLSRLKMLQFFGLKV
jgi:cysteine synthase